VHVKVDTLSEKQKFFKAETVVSRDTIILHRQRVGLSESRSNMNQSLIKKEQEMLDQDLLQDQEEYDDAADDPFDVAQNGNPF
jgi:hypothetical protein